MEAVHKIFSAMQTTEVGIESGNRSVSDNADVVLDEQRG